MNEKRDILEVLKRMAAALEGLVPEKHPPVYLYTADAFVWTSEKLRPVENINRIDIDLLKGIDHQKEVLLQNTRQFTRSLPANNVLLWGARGTGKSSLIKAVHARINEKEKTKIALVEIQREDLKTLPHLLEILRESERHVLLFCDDLSFEADDESYKSLKALLEGGVEGKPENVLFYATSNRRHLMSREMMENERSSAINTSETVEEKVSLSDRFGLWLGFHATDQDTYLEIVDGYAAAFQLSISKEKLHADALEWSITRGARSGRVAYQFITDLAGRMGHAWEEKK